MAIVDIPALFFLDCGVPRFRMDDGDCPAPDERCTLRVSLDLGEIKPAEPDIGAVASADYDLGQIEMKVYPSDKWRTLDGGPIWKSALDFLYDHHADAMEIAVQGAVSEMAFEMATA